MNGDQPVLVGGRALDILIALVERAGQIVSRRELLERVWPNIIVEEANLRVHVASLRKVLGDGQGQSRYITNVPGRGYCFVAPVRRLPAVLPTPSAGPLETGVDHRRLPAPLARIVGREETVAALCSLLKSQRFVSVVGAGGIGKTTVALGVGHALLGDYDDRVCFVDLGALTDADHIPGSIATTLGCLVQTQDPMSGLLAFLADKRILLVLDSCEHLIDAVARLAERLFGEAPMLHILATSREALRAEGENVYLLGPLDSPDEDGAQTAAHALASPAVQLFIDRAAASGHRFELTDAEAPVVAGICRRLDGIPLAIELAASRAGVYGIRGIAELLENRFRLLWQGRRSALPRHQTLQAMLDWSYNLLSAQEQLVLSRLSAFVGNFTIDGALAVAGDIGAETSGVADAVASLVDKSLVWISERASARNFRLPDTTRAYAAAKLAEQGGKDEVARRHTLYCIDQFRSGTIPAATFGGHDASAYAPHIGNVRAALDWCFSTSGDIVLGIELAAQSAPLFFGLSLLSEGERWCKHALTVLPETELGTERELALQEALAISSMYKRGNSDEVRTAIERAFSIAEELGDQRRQLHLLAGLNIFLARAGDHRATLAAAERGVAIAGEVRDPAGMIMAEFALGVAHHLAGHQAAAQHHCERGLILSAEWNCRRINFFGFDHRVRALTALARVLWLRGLPVRAVKTAREAVDEAMSRGHPVDLASALAHSTPVFLWAGDFETAADLVDRTIAHTTKHALRHYLSVGLALRGELTAARGELAVGLDLMREALTAFQAQQHNVHATILHGALAEGLARCGEFSEATIRIAGAVEAAERGGLPFNLPDLLRAQAEILLAAPRPDLEAVEGALLRSLEWARKQSALGWELRAAIPLARLWPGKGASEMPETCWQVSTSSSQRGLRRLTSRPLACCWVSLGMGRQEQGSPHPTSATGTERHRLGDVFHFFTTLGRRRSRQSSIMVAKLRVATLSASMPAMSLSDLPDPIPSFLRAVQAGDGAALRGTLEDGAVLTDDDRDSSIAASVWLDGLSGRGIKAMRAINEAKRRSEIVVTVLTIEADAGGHDMELLQDWHFTVRAGRIASVRIARRVNLILPAVVATFVRAANCMDLEVLLATFADDALVNDQLCDHRGEQAIRKWAAREILGERLTIHVVDVIEHRSHVVVTANINGDFDRRGLPDPLVLNLYFSLLGDRIEQLIILQNQPGT